MGLLKLNGIVLMDNQEVLNKRKEKIQNIIVLSPFVSVLV